MQESVKGTIGQVADWGAGWGGLVWRVGGFGGDRVDHLGLKPKAHSENPLKRVEMLDWLLFSPFQRTLAVSLGFEPKVGE
jgi:hypothetical protein